MIVAGPVGLPESEAVTTFPFLNVIAAPVNSLPEVDLNCPSCFTFNDQPASVPRLSVTWT